MHYCTGLHGAGAVRNSYQRWWIGRCVPPMVDDDDDAVTSFCNSLI
jgi:hypothetical protein